MELTNEDKQRIEQEARYQTNDYYQSKLSIEKHGQEYEPKSR